MPRIGGSKGPKAKAIKVKLIPETTADGKPSPEHALLAELRAKYHEHLEEARIALAFKIGTRASPEGVTSIGKAKKISDADKLLSDFDFLILLNEEFWSSEEVDRSQRMALLDHELTHCQVKLDKQGEPVRDAAGRPVWRIRRHDVEEFHDVARRWGLWTSTLEKLAGALAEKAQLPLLNQAKPSKRKARAAAGG